MYSPPYYRGRHQPDYEFRNPSYPRELLDLISPLECELCNVQFTAPIMGKMHYTGKKHLKEVRHFIQKWSSAHGLPIPRFEELRATSSDTMKPEYCEFCDVEMLTLNEKILHISGKKHLKNVNDPSKLHRSYKKRNTEQDTHGLQCKPCKMEFRNEQSMDEHKQTTKHKINLLNQEGGDRIIPGIEHWYCITCKEQYKDNAEYTAHLFEEKHMTLEMNCGSLQNELFYCTVCSLHMPQDEKDGHMSGLEHRRKVLLNSTMNLITKMANKNDNTLFYTCKDCPSAGSMNFIKFNNHLLSNAHIDRILASEEC